VGRDRACNIFRAEEPWRIRIIAMIDAMLFNSMGNCSKHTPRAVKAASRLHCSKKSYGKRAHHADRSPPC
jgi:hypothetical protein